MTTQGWQGWWRDRAKSSPVHMMSAEEITTPAETAGVSDHVAGTLPRIFMSAFSSPRQTAVRSPR